MFFRDTLTALLKQNKLLMGERGGTTSIDFGFLPEVT
jgi:hypothetical protein